MGLQDFSDMVYLNGTKAFWSTICKHGTPYLVFLEIHNGQEHREMSLDGRTVCDVGVVAHF